jgi:hypothetical protein
MFHRFVPSPRGRWMLIGLLAVLGLARLSPGRDDDEGEEDGGGSTSSGPPRTLVLAWNNLGMHCEDDRFETFSILPPFNTIVAQVIRNDHLLKSSAGVTVTYEAVADPSGSINTTSIGKSDFWQHVASLFGVALVPDHGLAGTAMPGNDNTPQPMTFDATRNAFVAEGIPITPYDDAGHKNTYPMMRVVVRDSASQAVLASSDVVLPVSDELTCITCHGSSAGDAAKPSGGWVNDTDPTKDYRSNILKLHDEKNQASPNYAALLATAGYAPAGLLATADAGTSILCARCHASNALPGSGSAGVKPLTEALHGHHATVVDPSTNAPLDAAESRAACYLCHPGSTTRCLRGAMGAAVATDGSLAMQCQDCHGSMSKVGAPGRVGWLDQPACQSCHTGTATTNSGQIRFTNAFASNGQWRTPADSTFATDPNTPGAGFDLYQFSTGHGGLACEACHGSTHAEYPSSHASDNVQAIALQGHAGTIAECSTCHGNVPKTVSGGPHGMHPVGAAWVHDHEDVAEDGGAAQCRSCHGANYKGSVLSRALGPRTLSTGDFGTKHWWQGFQVSCYACHGGPDGEGSSGNHAPKVYDKTGVTNDVTPLPLALKATDADGQSLELRVVKQPEHGTVGLIGKTATFFPESGAVGSSEFTYAAWDGKVNSNLGTVTLTVTDSQCPTTLTPSVLHFDANGGDATIDVAMPGTCDWVAGTGATSWVSFRNGDAHSGPQTLALHVASNAGLARSTTITVRGVAATVMQTGMDSPNLAAHWLAYATQCPSPPSTAACKLVVKVQIVNGGGATAKKSKLRIVLSADPIVDALDTTLAQRTVKKIAPGHARTLKTKVKLPAGVDPTGMYVLAVADATGVVFEGSESDNASASDPLP